MESGLNVQQGGGDPARELFGLGSLAGDVGGLFLTVAHEIFDGGGGLQAEVKRGRYVEQVQGDGSGRDEPEGQLRRCDPRPGTASSHRGNLMPWLYPHSLNSPTQAKIHKTRPDPLGIIVVPLLSCNAPFKL